MFEDLKTGNMIKKLIKLANYNERLNQYDKRLKDFIPKNVLTEDTFEYFIGSSNFIYNEYTLKLNNIKYVSNEKGKHYVKVNNIIIAKAGQFGLKTEWNHKLPKEMLSQIKKDSKIIDGYIKDIKDYMKNNKTTEQLKHYEEQKELEKIFCGK